jgi:hypothetical protein
MTKVTNKQPSSPLWAGTAYDINLTLPFWSGAIMQGLALLVSFRYRKIPQAQVQAQPEAAGAASESAEANKERDLHRRRSFCLESRTAADYFTARTSK